MLGKVYLCQGRPKNVREIVPISENVRGVWEKKILVNNGIK